MSNNSNSSKGLVYRVEMGENGEDSFDSYVFTNYRDALMKASKLLNESPYEWKGEALIGTEIASWSSGCDYLSVYADVA